MKKMRVVKTVQTKPGLRLPRRVSPKPLAQAVPKSREKNPPERGRQAEVDPRLQAAYARGRDLRKKVLGVEGGSIPEKQAAGRLGISRAALLRQYRNGQVLGWREPGATAVQFPLWQFQGHKLLPGLSEVLTTLDAGCKLDDIGRILFFLVNFRSFGGWRPLDLLREGRTRDALRAAKSYMQL